MNIRELKFKSCPDYFFSRNSGAFQYLDASFSQHQFQYKNAKAEIKNITSSLVVKGEDQTYTAMAKTVGLPLGIATKLILQDKLHLRGLHIPTAKPIYEPVLKELEKHGVVFKEMVTVL